MSVEKCYLTVVSVEGIKYIKLAKSETGHALDAYNTIEEALQKFKSFKQKMHGNYESHISGSMGILNLSPHIIEVEKDNPQSLKAYLIKDKAIILKGSMFGVFVDMVGAEVKETILELSVLDVANKFVKELYT